MTYDAEITLSLDLISKQKLRLALMEDKVPALRNAATFTELQHTDRQVVEAMKAKLNRLVDNHSAIFASSVWGIAPVPMAAE